MFVGTLVGGCDGEPVGADDGGVGFGVGAPAEQSVVIVIESIYHTSTA